MNHETILHIEFLPHAASLLSVNTRAKQRKNVHHYIVVLQENLACTVSDLHAAHRDSNPEMYTLYHQAAYWHIHSTLSSLEDQLRGGNIERSTEKVRSNKELRTKAGSGMTVLPQKIGGPLVLHQPSPPAPSCSQVTSHQILGMVAPTRRMKHELQVASTLTDLPNELLYAVFNHVERSDLLSLARVSCRLNAVAMRHYLGPWHEFQKDYSVFGGYLTDARCNFFSLRYLQLSLATPYILSMTLMFSLNFAAEFDEVLRYHRSIPPKRYPSLHIDFTSTTKQCIVCQSGMSGRIYVERLHRFCEGLVRLRCVSFKCLRTGWECLGGPATSGKKAVFHPPPFTTLTSMCIPSGSTCFLDWLVRSARASPIESLTLRYIRDIYKKKSDCVWSLRLPHLKHITFDSCSFAPEHLSSFLSRHIAITDLTFFWGDIAAPRSWIYTIHMRLPHLHTIVMGIRNLEHLLPSMRPRSFPSLKSVVMLGCECRRCDGPEPFCEWNTGKSDIRRVLYWISRLPAVSCVQLPFEFPWDTISGLTLPRITKLVSKRCSVASNLKRVTPVSVFFPNVDEFEVVEIGIENNEKLMEEINERWTGLRCVTFSSRLSYTRE
ncbi:hypothetical protein EV421DRAFT_1229851 [Armillaria borealis]|uniref:F-box domain-containing protein n=1 Tax=Armillaria borealis TaxID=47425 RepID=A0AA39MJC1_9AGAR|nr:hypothetical protein EV421DRAFT_1229851 [Armillaria borealis]